jgi:uncharacterized protein (UPF0264 family)
MLPMTRAPIGDGPRGDWAQGLLVSVRDAGEAVAALAGASIVDVKEPSRGPLGRPDASVAADVLRVVDGRAFVTLACGELADSPRGISEYVADVLARLPEGVPGPVAVKAGPSGLGLEAWRDCFRALVDKLPRGVEAVAVAYADTRDGACLTPDEVLESAASSGARAVLVDTFDKAGPGLFEQEEVDQSDATVLGRWVQHAGAHGLALALAGKLTQADVVVAMNLGADVVGVRSAACDGGRLGRVDAARVRTLGRLVLECRTAGMAHKPGVWTS